VSPWWFFRVVQPCSASGWWPPQPNVRSLTSVLDAPKKQRHTARRILARLVDEHGAVGLSYSTVRDHVRKRRPQVLAEAGRPLEFRGQGQSVTAGELALAPRGQRLHSWIALSHLLLVFNNPFARLAGFSGRERTPLPRYEQSEDLHRPIHPGHVTDERAAFKVEEVD
jgi:hypothetical protein